MTTSSTGRAIVSATVRAQLGGLRRRFRDLLINLVMVYVTFFIITTAVRTLAGVGASSASALPSITVAFLTWTAALTVYGDLTLALTRNTATPLTVARGGWARAQSLAVWFLGSTLIASAAWLALLFAMRATVEQQLHVDVPSLLPLLVLTVAGAFGVAMLASARVVMRGRASSLVQLLPFAFIAFVAAPVERFDILRFAPLAWGNEMIGRVMISGLSLRQIDAAELWFLVGVTAAWASAGLVALLAAARRPLPFSSRSAPRLQERGR